MGNFSVIWPRFRGRRRPVDEVVWRKPDRPGSLEVTVAGRPASPALQSLHHWARDTPRPVAAVLRYGWLMTEGDRPRVSSELTRRLLSRHPTTYRQKVLYKLARDRRPLLTTFADKVAVRDYVSCTVGSHLLKRVYAVVPRGELIPWNIVPETFVCKVSHGSRGSIVVADFADPRWHLPSPDSDPGWTRYLVHPLSADRADIASLCDYWLTLRYGRERGQSYEWAYRQIPPRILVEELYTLDGGLPRELWLHCFDGEPKCFIIITRGSHFEEERTVRLLEEESAQAQVEAGLDDAAWAEVVEASRRLSTPTDAVRVDWLLTDQGPRFCELTNYPAVGKLDFLGHPSKSPTEMHDVIAGYWTVPRRYR